MVHFDVINESRWIFVSFLMALAVTLFVPLGVALFLLFFRCHLSILSWCLSICVSVGSTIDLWAKEIFESRFSWYSRWFLEPQIQRAKWVKFVFRGIPVCSSSLKLRLHFCPWASHSSIICYVHIEDRYLFESRSCWRLFRSSDEMSCREGGTEEWHLLFWMIWSKPIYSQVVEFEGHGDKYVTNDIHEVD